MGSNVDNVFDQLTHRTQEDNAKGVQELIDAIFRNIHQNQRHDWDTSEFKSTDPTAYLPGEEDLINYIGGAVQRSLEVEIKSSLQDQDVRKMNKSSQDQPMWDEYKEIDKALIIMGMQLARQDEYQKNQNAYQKKQKGGSKGAAKGRGAGSTNPRTEEEEQERRKKRNERMKKMCRSPFNEYVAKQLFHGMVIWRHVSPDYKAKEYARQKTQNTTQPSQTEEEKISTQKQYVLYELLSASNILTHDKMSVDEKIEEYILTCKIKETILTNASTLNMQDVKDCINEKTLQYAYEDVEIPQNVKALQLLLPEMVDMETYNQRMLHIATQTRDAKSTLQQLLAEVKTDAVVEDDTEKSTRKSNILQLLHSKVLSSEFMVSEANWGQGKKHALRQYWQTVMADVVTALDVHARVQEKDTNYQSFKDNTIKFTASYIVNTTQKNNEWFQDSYKYLWDFSEVYTAWQQMQIGGQQSNLDELNGKDLGTWDEIPTQMQTYISAIQDYVKWETLYKENYVQLTQLNAKATSSMYLFMTQQTQATSLTYDMVKEFAQHFITLYTKWDKESFAIKSKMQRESGAWESLSGKISQIWESYYKETNNLNDDLTDVPQLNIIISSMKTLCSTLTNEQTNHYYHNQCILLIAKIIGEQMANQLAKPKDELYRFDTAHASFAEISSFKTTLEPFKKRLQSVLGQGAWTLYERITVFFLDEYQNYLQQREQLQSPEPSFIFKPDIIQLCWEQAGAVHVQGGLMLHQIEQFIENESVNDMPCRWQYKVWKEREGIDHYNRILYNSCNFYNFGLFRSKYQYSLDTWIQCTHKLDGWFPLPEIRISEFFEWWKGLPPDGRIVFTEEKLKVTDGSGKVAAYILNQLNELTSSPAIPLPTL